MKKRLFILFGGILGTVATLAAGLLLFLTVTEYKPAPEQAADFLVHTTQTDTADSELTIYSWNIGYAGLGKDSDFFMDGGTMVNPPSQALVEMINKPVGVYRLDKVVENLKRFQGNFILQTMFLKSPEFDTVADGALEAWMDIVRILKPRQVMVYTMDRETPDKTLMTYSVGQMTAMVQPLIDEGFNLQIRG